MVLHDVNLSIQLVTMGAHRPLQMKKVPPHLQLLVALQVSNKGCALSYECVAKCVGTQSIKGVFFMNMQS